MTSPPTNTTRFHLPSSAPDPPRHPDVTGIILAGGEGSRLGGVNKARLRFTELGDETILARILSTFCGRFSQAILVLGRDQTIWSISTAGIDVLIAHDRLVKAGPLAGIEAGLTVAATPFAFVCAADMPFLSGPLIDAMARSASDGRALVPLRAGRPEPLHAIYPRACLPEVTASLNAGARTIRDVLARLPVDWMTQERWEGIEGADQSFDNINTPDDLGRAGLPPAEGDQ